MLSFPLCKTLQRIKFAWHPKIENQAVCSLEQVEEVDLDDLDEYTEMLEVDELAADFDRLEYEDEIVTIVLDD